MGIDIKNDFDLKNKEKIPLSSENNLCKMLIGIGFKDDSEAVLQVMLRDRVGISEKYGIPLSEKYKNKSEYAGKLLAMAKEKNFSVKMVDKSELEKINSWGGITKNGKILVPEIDLSNCTEVEANNWTIRFVHELTHAYQLKMDPDMSIERQEYEAYVLSYLPTVWVNSMHDHPEMDEIQYYMTDSYIFEKIKGSCLGYYKRTGVTEDKISWMVNTNIVQKKEGKVYNLG